MYISINISLILPHKMVYDFLLSSSAGVAHTATTVLE